MPNDFVCLIYLTTCLAASMWPDLPSLGVAQVWMWLCLGLGVWMWTTIEVLPLFFGVQYYICPVEFNSHSGVRISRIIANPWRPVIPRSRQNYRCHSTSLRAPATIRSRPPCLLCTGPTIFRSTNPVQTPSHSVTLVFNIRTYVAAWDVYVLKWQLQLATRNKKLY